MESMLDTTEKLSLAQLSGPSLSADEKPVLDEEAAAILVE